MPGPNYYSELHTWIEEWYGNTVRLTLPAAVIDRVDQRRRDAHNVVMNCERHRGTEYREAIMPPMPTFDQQDDIANAPQPQVITHSIEDMQRGLIRTAAELTARFSDPDDLDVRVLEPGDPERWHVFDGVGVMRIRWSEPGDPERWHDESAGSSEQAAAASTGALDAHEAARLRELGPVAGCPCSSCQEAHARGVPYRPNCGPGERPHGRGTVFGAVALNGEQFEPGEPGYEQAIAIHIARRNAADAKHRKHEAIYQDLMNRDIAPTWGELRSLAEDGFPAGAMRDILDAHDLEYMEPTAQLRPEGEVPDDDYDEDELGAETDSMLGMGEAEQWFREHREASHD